MIIRFNIGEMMGSLLFGRMTHLLECRRQNYTKYWVFCVTVDLMVFRVS